MSCRSKTGDRAAGPVQIPIGWVGAMGGERQDLDLRGGSASASATREWELAPGETASGGGCGGQGLMSRRSETREDINTPSISHQKETVRLAPNPMSAVFSLWVMLLR
jgi:hypothetical protein